jgi:formate hydrogenlyase subunit 3/multisubunit Na+/H+ antiporter MnhD subunit
VLSSGSIHILNAVKVITGSTIDFTINAGFPFGDIPVRIDSLSAFFMIVVTFTLSTGVVYGYHYMSKYNAEPEKQSLQWCSYILLQAGMMGVCMMQNILGFLISWEIMTVAALMLVIYDYETPNTIRAGLNYFVQSHIGVLLIITGFIWTASAAGSFDLAAIIASVKNNSIKIGPWPFMILFIGFAFKAGFVPLHTWLPWAHPAAPSHISGVMSGVIIKMGIYGIFRILPVYQGNMLQIGRLILLISVATALYGVMVAIIQHNLKRLLAYHSVENIGIIGMGIGLGAIGTGIANNTVAFTGYCGALLHTLNHSLFKSLLFFTAGSVYRKAHTLNIEELGGIAKKMPYTAALFLVAALAITGLPPFNGFVSEFLIYSSMYTGMTSGDLSFSMIFLCCIFALVMVGGLAFLCFTKAFGIVFLGTPRHHIPEDCVEVERWCLVPQFAILTMILLIGFFPLPFIKLVSRPALTLIPGMQNPGEILAPVNSMMLSISSGAILIAVICGAIYGLKLFVTRKAVDRSSPTWGCGYTGSSPKLQYTATSFVKSYTVIASPLLRIKTTASAIKGLFPEKGEFHIRTYDKLEEKLIDGNLTRVGNFMTLFAFLQNGLIQYYILYGVIFIIAVMGFTFRKAVISFIISFLALG